MEKEFSKILEGVFTKLDVWIGDYNAGISWKG